MTEGDLRATKCTQNNPFVRCFSFAGSCPRSVTQIMLILHPAHPSSWAWRPRGHPPPPTSTPTGWPRRGRPTCSNTLTTQLTGEEPMATHFCKANTLLPPWTNVTLVSGIHGDKTLLTEQSMKTSPSFYQVDSTSPTWLYRAFHSGASSPRINLSVRRKR